MPVRFVFLVFALTALAGLLVVMGDGGDEATAAPPGWVSLIVPGLARDAAPAPTPTPSATGNRGLRIYIELDMFNEDRWQTVTGDIRLPAVPPVFTQPIKIRGKYALGQGPSASGCSWEQRQTDTEFGATIYWTPNASELFVEFDWMAWEDWATCRGSDVSVRVVAPYPPLQYHADAVFGVWRDPVFFFRYLIPLNTTTTSTFTHRANYALIGENTKGKIYIDFCRAESISPHCEWGGLFNEP